MPGHLFEDFSARQLIML